MFDDREQEFENKFKHDEQLRFRAVARRNRLLGEWAAGVMKLPGEEVDEYARQVVLADFDEPGDDDVVRKILRDAEAAGAPLSETEIRAEMDRLLEEARKQILAE